VVARFEGIGTSAAAKVQALAFRGRRYEFTADGTTWYRFLQGTQAGPHVLSGPACALQRLDGPGAASFRRFVIRDASGAGGDYRVTFSVVPMRCSDTTPA